MPVGLVGMVEVGPDGCSGNGPISMNPLPLWRGKCLGVTLLSLRATSVLLSSAEIRLARTDATIVFSSFRISFKTRVRNVVKLSEPLSGATCSNPAAAMASTLLVESVILADEPA